MISKYPTLKDCNQIKKLLLENDIITKTKYISKEQRPKNKHNKK